MAVKFVVSPTTQKIVVFAEAIAGRANKTPNCPPVNLSNTWAPPHFCPTIRQWAELCPGETLILF